MSEGTMRRRVVRELRELDAVSVENPVHPGTPDVNFIGGWVELKWARRWPERGGPLRLDHFTREQRVWLRRRWHRGGAAWLLLQVGREWMLFDGEVAAHVVGRSTRGELQRHAAAHWPDGLDSGDLLQMLRRGRTYS